MSEHIAIIGAGIIGLSTAVALQRLGHRITLIDKQGVAAGASQGNAGHFATEQVFPLADPALLPQLPSMLMDPKGPFRIRPGYLLQALPWFMQFLNNMRNTHRQANILALKALNEPALDAQELLLQVTGATHLYKRDGALLVFETPNNAHQAIADMYHQQDVALEMLSGDQARELEPTLSKGIQQAIYFTDVAHTLSPQQLCQHYFDYLIEQGAQFEKQTVTGITDDGKEVVIGCLERAIKADKVLIAAGPWSKTLVKQLGYKVPLEAERGYHLMLPQHGKTLSRPVSSAERKFIMTGMQDGLRLAGTVEFAGLESPANYQRAEVLLHHARHLIPALQEAESGQSWMGNRPSLPDSLPVMDQCHQRRNIYFSFGHQHLGLTQSAISAQLMSEVMAGLTPQVDMHPYRITRF